MKRSLVAVIAFGLLGLSACTGTPTDASETPYSVQEYVDDELLRARTLDACKHAGHEERVINKKKPACINVWAARDQINEAWNAENYARQKQRLEELREKNKALAEKRRSKTSEQD